MRRNWDTLNWDTLKGVPYRNSTVTALSVGDGFQAVPTFGKRFD